MPAWLPASRYLAESRESAFGLAELLLRLIQRHSTTFSHSCYIQRRAVDGGSIMTLEQSSFIAQIISAIAVIASLIFVGFQLKQATGAIRASSSQAHSALYTSIVQNIITNGDFARIWSIGLTHPEKLRDDEWVRFVAHCSALFRLYESSRVQWHHGRLERDHWHAVERQATSMGSQPGVKAAWALRGHWYSEGFRDWYELLTQQESEQIYARQTAEPAN